MMNVAHYINSASITEKAKAFEYLLEYHIQESKDKRAIVSLTHKDQVCRMNTYLRAVMENDIMLDCELVMNYDIWGEEE